MWKVIFGLMTSVCLMPGCHNAVLPQYTLQEGDHGQCNETIYSETSVILRSQANAGLYNGLTFYQANQNCSASFQVAPGNQILLTFSFFDLEAPSGDDCVDKIVLAEIGDNSTDVPFNETTEFCTIQTYTSGTNKLQIHFLTNGVVQKKGFAMLLTSFHQGNCSVSEFICDNDRCIPSSLKCDGHNHCIDAADEDRELAECPPENIDTTGIFSLGKFAILVIVGLVSVLVFMIFITVIIWKNADKDSCQYRSSTVDVDDISKPSPHIRSETRTIVRGHSNTKAREPKGSTTTHIGASEPKSKKTGKIKVKPAPDAKW